MLTLLAAAIVYQATVVKVIDGDTLKVHVAGFPAPFDPINVRIVGLDTPEHRMPPAKAQCEVALGVKAAEFAQQLVTPGQTVSVTYTLGVNDKYGRLLGSVTLPDGRDWAATMIKAGEGRSYGLDGHLTKAGWC
jgi:endonuclease YncB( thermonuclease family)